MIDLATDRVTAEDQRNHARKRVETEQEQVDKCEAAAKQLEEEYEVCFCLPFISDIIDPFEVVGKASIQLLRWKQV